MTPGAEIARASETPEATQELMQRWARDALAWEHLKRAAEMAAWSTCHDD